MSSEARTSASAGDGRLVTGHMSQRRGGCRRAVTPVRQPRGPRNWKEAWPWAPSAWEARGTRRRSMSPVREDPSCGLGFNALSVSLTGLNCRERSGPMSHPQRPESGPVFWACVPGSRAPAPLGKPSGHDSHGGAGLVDGSLWLHHHVAPDLGRTGHPPAHPGANCPLSSKRWWEAGWLPPHGSRGCLE